MGLQSEGHHRVTAQGQFPLPTLTSIKAIQQPNDPGIGDGLAVQTDMEPVCPLPRAPPGPTPGTKTEPMAKPVSELHWADL